MGVKQLYRKYQPATLHSVRRRYIYIHEVNIKNYRVQLPKNLGFGKQQQKQLHTNWQQPYHKLHGTPNYQSNICKDFPHVQDQQHVRITCLWRDGQPTIECQLRMMYHMRLGLQQRVKLVLHYVHLRRQLNKIIIIIIIIKTNGPL